MVSRFRRSSIRQLSEAPKGAARRRVVEKGRELRRLKDETAECKYRRPWYATPCVNPIDSAGVQKRADTLRRTMRGIRLTPVQRDTGPKGCFNEFIRSRGDARAFHPSARPKNASRAPAGSTGPEDQRSVEIPIGARLFRMSPGQGEEGVSRVTVD